MRDKQGFQWVTTIRIASLHLWLSEHNGEWKKITKCA